MPRRHSATAAAAALAVIALALTACSGSTEPGSTDSGSANSNATLTVGLVLEPENLDIRHTSGAALEQLLIDNVYQGLVTRAPDDGNEIVGALASDWSVSEDGLVYTFTLEEGVTFHSGDELTADDVVASYDEVQEDESIQGHEDFAGVESISAPDDATVEITLAEPDIDFLFALTGRAGLVFAEGDDTNMNTQANGTGPFLLDTWTQGASVTLVRNDEYWGDPAGVAEVVLQYIPDFSAGVNAALDGTVDVLTAVDPELVGQLEGAGGFTVTAGETTDKATLAFNNLAEPLDDPRVREALRLAIDRNALADAVGSAQTLYGPIPPLDPGYEELSDVVSYDPDRSRQLLAEAGEENLELTLTIPAFYGTTVPTYLVSAFNDVGVTLSVNSVEFTTWLNDAFMNKDYELSFVLHVEARDFGNWADPDYYFQYDNPQVQSLYAEATETTDAEESSRLLAEAARIVSEDSAADWLYLATTLTALAPGIDGFPMNSINVRLDLSHVTVAE